MVREMNSPNSQESSLVLIFKKSVPEKYCGALLLKPACLRRCDMNYIPGNSGYPLQARIHVEDMNGAQSCLPATEQPESRE